MDTTKSTRNVYSIDQILGTTHPSKNGTMIKLFLIDNLYFFGAIWIHF